MLFRSYRLANAVVMATVTSDEEVPPQNMASMVSLTRNVQLYTTFSEVMQVGEQAAASGEAKGE